MLGDIQIRNLNTAWLHAGANVLAVLVELYNWYSRYSHGSEAVLPTGLILSAVVVAILVFSGWKGWEMVYRHRVEHAGMMAHLLDPTEKALFAKASAFEARFANAAALGAGPGDPVMAAAREIIDFKTVAEQGICSGQIKSIIDPELGAHMRREAIRFTDELQRASIGPMVGSSAAPTPAVFFGR